MFANGQSTERFIRIIVHHHTNLKQTPIEFTSIYRILPNNYNKEEYKSLKYSQRQWIF
jgi:hypothetical protein